VTAAKQPGQKADNGANNNAGDDRKVKLGMPAPEVNVAGESAKPAASKSRPHDDAEQGDGQTEDDEGLS
jgi:hypothetical protein